MRDLEHLHIQRLIVAFNSASVPLHRHLQQRRPLSSLQLKSLSLTVSLTQFYLERWMKQHRKTTNFPGGELLLYRDTVRSAWRFEGGKGKSQEAVCEETSCNRKTGGIKPLGQAGVMTDGCAAILPRHAFSNGYHGSPITCMQLDPINKM